MDFPHKSPLFPILFLFLIFNFFLMGLFLILEIPSVRNQKRLLFRVLFKLNSYFYLFSHFKQEQPCTCSITKLKVIKIRSFLLGVQELGI